MTTVRYQTQFAVADNWPSSIVPMRTYVRVGKRAPSQMANSMADRSYEVCVFDSGSVLKRVIPLCCPTDTDALMNLVRIGVGDFQKVAIWRGRECIYSGRDVTSAALQLRGSVFVPDETMQFSPNEQTE